MPGTRAVRALRLGAVAAALRAPAGALGSWVYGTWTTGYWDCCKPSCSWPGKGSVNQSTLACSASTGAVLSDTNVASVCDGGDAATCASNLPFQVSEDLSMGFAAAAVGGVSGLNGDANCGQCFELVFTSQRHSDGTWPWGGAHPELVDKRHVVQVTNIGYDVSGVHSFDLLIPGAGQGIFTSGCTRQFPGYTSGDFDCDNNYGGCSSRSGCERLPPELRPGCYWRYDWYRWLAASGQTNNPFVSFRRVRCPQQLTAISNSVPLDDDSYPYHTGYTTTHEYTEHLSTNCYDGAGAVNIDYVSGSNVGPTGYTIEECKAFCSVTTDCDCVLFDRETNQCLRRKDCTVAQCVTSDKWDLYVKKQEAPPPGSWLDQEGGVNAAGFRTASSATWRGPSWQTGFWLLAVQATRR